LSDTQTEEERQLDLEDYGISLGIKKYQDSLLIRDITDLPPGVRLLKMALEPTAGALIAFLDTSNSGHARYRESKEFLRKFDPNVVAFLTAKRILNSLGNHNQESFQAIAVSITEMLISHLDYEQFKEEAPGYVYVIEKDNRWASESHRRATILRAKNNLLGRIKMETPMKLLIGAKCIELFIGATGLVESLLIRNPSNGKENYHLCAAPETAEWLAKANAECELLQPVHFPMIVPPRHWDAPVGGGFLTNAGTLQVQLVKTRNLEELMSLADQDLSQVYSALNTIQDTQWRINTTVLDAMSAIWEMGGGLAGLPQRELPEIPQKPWGPDEVPDKDVLIAWKKLATTVHERHARQRSKRVATDIKLFIANRMHEEKAIYFVWNLDWRGRMYPLQQFVNPQIDDSGRGLLEFAEGKPLGESGAFWLAVHGANTFGYDKASFEDRLQWVLDNEADILASACDPLRHVAFWESADAPFQFLAFCHDWAGYRSEGESYVSHLPIALDGSCNGLQNFSAMLLDQTGGEATNLVPAETPSDIYQEVADVLNVMVEEDALNGVEGAEPWRGKVTRKVTKRPTMTTPYGVSRFGIRKQLKFEVEKIDKNYLSLESPGIAYGYLSGRLYDAIGNVVVAAREAMNWLQGLASVTAKAGKVIRWTTPIGFRPCQDYRKQKLVRVTTLHGGIQFHLWQDTPKLDMRKMAYGIAPNFVHSLDASHCMLTVNKCQKIGIKNFSMIHDSYGTLAADVSTLAHTLRETFIEMYSGNVLEKLRDEVVAQLPLDLALEIPPLPEKGELDLLEVRNSRYFFA